jgi:hypothetical protein
VADISVLELSSETKNKPKAGAVLKDSGLSRRVLKAEFQSEDKAWLLADERDRLSAIMTPA